MIDNSNSASRNPAPVAAARARLAPQTADEPGAYCGPYAAGGVWAVLDGRGVLQVGAEGLARREIEVTHPGAYPLLEHERRILQHSLENAP